MATQRKPSKPEFEAKKGSKPGAVRKTEREDAKNDRALARKNGVKYTGR